ncbi:hypothetical protein FRB93_005934 [Tulasnella sp. JGI-2019a]|nr:hypothetical protein FRB93_005934 [Tulasnella sp. JGI-2019a]
MATAIETSYYNNSAWDDAIVPTLRKRLESESRMLENRLSGPSSSSFQPGEDLAPPVHSSTSTRQQKRAPSPAYPTSSPTSQLQDSGIPRPSISASREPSNSSMNQYGNGSSRSPQTVNDQMRPYTAMNTSNSNTGAGFKRTRTHSTPYAFDRDEGASGRPAGGRKSPANITTNGLTGMPTPASSRANSPMIGSAPIGQGQSSYYSAVSAGNNNNSKILNDRPSKIPMRKRQRSNSNAPTHTASSGRHTITPDDIGGRRYAKGVDTAHQAVMFPPSPETSPELWLERNDPDMPPPNGVPKIKDETAPFNPKCASRASFEEREFEHWYRGEGREGGGRNGGVGEIKVAKADTTKEMLDIAVGGHVLPGRDRWAPRTRAVGNYQEDSLARTRHPDPSMEYVMDETALTDMDGDATDYYVAEPEQHVYGNVEPEPEPYGGEDLDLDDYYYGAATGPVAGRSSTSLPPAAVHSTTGDAAETKSPPAFASRVPSRASQTSHKIRGSSDVPPPPKTPQPDKNRRPSTTTTTGTPRKSSDKSSSKIPNSRAREQSRVRQRAISRGDERPPPLADAIPPWAQSPPPPENGNWDEVVLPTVAKKMGLTSKSEVDVTMLGDGKPKRQEMERTFEPAPGTFAYDRTKLRSPSNSSTMGDLEFGGKQSQESGRRSEQTSPSPRPPSPPPFAAYMPIAAEEYIPQPRPESRQILAPSPVPKVIPEEPPRGRKRESTKVQPAIVVTSPSVVGVPGRTAKVEEEDDAGGCKCVIM